MTRIRRIFTDLLLVSVMLFFSTCEENLISPIPSFPVFVQLNLFGLDNDLIPVSSTKCIIQPRVATEKLGFGGILIINAGVNSLIDLHAFDLACPNHVPIALTIRVAPNDAGKAVCPQCSAVYNILFGTGICESGGKYPLRSYSVQPIGNNQYVIRN